MLFVKKMIDGLIYHLSEAPKGLDFARNVYPYKKYSDNIWYERANKRHINQIFSYFTQRDLPVIDIGCGKGYVLYCLHKMGFTDITGLEYDEKLAGTARANMHKLGLLPHVDIIRGDARHFDEYDKYQIFYMFNPFRAPVMERVVGHIERSLKRRPRPATVVYFDPAQCHLWDESPLFTMVHKKQMEYANVVLDVFYYEHDPDENPPSFKEILMDQMR